MGKVHRYALVLAVSLLAVGLSSCATGGWRFKWGAPPEETAATEETAAAETADADTTGTPEARLTMLVRRHIESASRGAGEDSARLLRRKPYYFREFVEYPGGADDFSVDIRDTESKTAPMRADVRVRKVRYATRLHGDRKAAAADDHFIRNTGWEELSYEYRLGRWRRLGSVFIAERSEQQVDGAWAPLRDEPAAPTAPTTPVKKSWLSRLKFWGAE